jgi:hypothetical protein
VNRYLNIKALNMKCKSKNIPLIIWSFKRRNIKSSVLIVLIIFCIQRPLQAQRFHESKHSWWFGIAAAANLNFYRGSTQELNSSIIAPVAFHNGIGGGLNLASMAEFHIPFSSLGIMLQSGYDNRSSSFDEKVAPCGCDLDLSANISYITFEPSLVIAPVKSNFYLFAGPRVAFNLTNSFTYTITTRSDLNNQNIPLTLNGKFSKMNEKIYSVQIGVGYEIPFSSKHNPTQYVFSPFVAFQPYFGQLPRSIETWNITTLRVGAVFKFSQRKVRSIHRKRNKRLY